VRVVFVTRDSPAGHTADPQGAVETRFDGQVLEVALPRQVAGLAFTR
jgi:hypothetical protein